MICYHSIRWFQALAAMAVLGGAHSASAGSIAPVDCFSRTEQGLCAGLSFARADSLFGTPASGHVASTAHPFAASIDLAAATAATDFTTPSFGLDSTTPPLASADVSPQASTPTAIYQIQQRGRGAIDATLPAGESAEFQQLNWGSTFDATLLFDGPGDTVEVELTYEADGRFSAPRGAKDRPDSGMLNLIGGLLLRESTAPAPPPVLEYYGEFIFLPYHATHPATASNQWTPEDVAELGDQDTLAVDPQREVAELSVSDVVTFTVATGTSYRLEGFFTGGAMGELFLDSAAEGQLRWGSLADATAVATFRVLTPEGTLVPIVPIPEATGATALLAGLIVVVIGSERRRTRPVGGTSSKSGDARR